MGKRPLIILFAIATLGFTDGYAKEVNLDSLWSVWNDEGQADTVRLQAMKDIAWSGYLFSQPDSAFYFAQLHYDFAKRNGLKKNMATALNTQGASFYIQGDNASAIDYYSRSLTIKIQIVQSFFR